MKTTHNQDAQSLDAEALVAPGTMLVGDLRMRKRLRILSENRRPVSLRCGMARRLAGVVVAAIVAVGVQIPLAAPAAAVQGVHRVASPSAIPNSNSQRQATATCPAGERVLGGGGEILGLVGDNRTRVVLTRLEPVNGSGQDRYIVDASEIQGGTTAFWSMQAYAMCVPAASLPGLHIVPASNATSSDPAPPQAIAFCPANERAMGSGARLSNRNGEVYLQVARASGPGDIVRAQGHEDADGFSGQWFVTAFAVCAPPPPGYETRFGESVARASETFKNALATCPAGKTLLSSGAAATDVAPGNIALTRIRPDLPNAVRAQAVEATPTTASWDFIVAHAICAS